jgi:hypothetical protein
MARPTVISSFSPQAGVPEGRQAADAVEQAAECGVCLAEPDDGPHVKLVAPLPCKHTACVDCWTQYLKVARQGGQAPKEIQAPYRPVEGGL